MFPVRQTLSLSGGHVTLRAWPATVADGHLLDLLTLTATLGQIREDWASFTRQDVDSSVWDAFWRLTRVALEPGSKLPPRLTWDDRLTILTAMWELNDVEASEGKLMALSQRAVNLMTRIQGRTTPRSMN